MRLLFAHAYTEGRTLPIQARAVLKDRLPIPVALRVAKRKAHVLQNIRLGQECPV